MRKVLVTGVAGFIGSNLAEKLLELNFQVIGIDNFDAFYSRAIKEKNLETCLSNPNFTFIEGDYGQPDAFLNDLFVDLVIHLGAKPGVRPSLENPEEFIENNIHKTKKLLDWMKDKNIKKLIFASSSSVYGNCKTIPFAESSPTDDPISIYAYTKKSCEILNHLYHHLFQFDIINLRFFTVYGERQRPDLAIHKFFKSILEGKQIPLYGDGTTSRDYTYVQDIIAGIIGAIDYISTNKTVFETINLGSKTPIKLLDLVKQIEKITQKTAQINWLPMQEGDVDRTYADISKASKLLKYTPQTSIETGLTNFYRWLDIKH